MHSILIIGSGLAGYNLVKEIRKTDRDVDITIVTGDDGCFYSKPLLSTGLAKSQSADDLAMASAEKMANDYNINVINHTRVAAIDPDRNCITTHQAELHYKQLVLAMGAEPVALSTPFDTPAFTINSRNDYARYRSALEQPGIKRIAIIGAGLIGCEFAHDLVSSGYEVEIIANSDYPLNLLLPPAAGDYLQHKLSALGIGWHLATSVEQCQNSMQGKQLSLANGNQLEADLVISAIGLKPATQLAQQAGISTAQGICVDQTLRTNVNNIYALGDCAEVCGYNLQYVLPLMASARALAQTLLGSDQKVAWPAMPITVKLPSIPTCVYRPPTASQGTWETESDEHGLKSILMDNDKIKGFALMGNRIKERMTLTKGLGDILTG